MIVGVYVPSGVNDTFYWLNQSYQLNTKATGAQSLRQTEIQTSVAVVRLWSPLTPTYTLANCLLFAIDLFPVRQPLAHFCSYVRQRVRLR